MCIIHQGRAKPQQAKVMAHRFHTSKAAAAAAVAAGEEEGEDVYVSHVVSYSIFRAFIRFFSL